MRLTRCFRAFRQSERGASLIELAVVIPFLAMFLVIAVDFGGMYATWLHVTNASHAGAEYGLLYPKDSTGITEAAQQVNPNVTVLSVAYYCECSDGTLSSLSCVSGKPACASGTSAVDMVQVTTTEVYNTIIPWNLIPTPMFPHLAGPSTLTFAKTTSVRAPYQ